MCYSVILFASMFGTRAHSSGPLVCYSVDGRYIMHVMCVRACVSTGCCAYLHFCGTSWRAGLCVCVCVCVYVCVCVCVRGAEDGILSYYHACTQMIHRPYTDHTQPHTHAYKPHAHAHIQTILQVSGPQH